MLIIPPWTRQHRFHGDLSSARGGSFSQATKDDAHTLSRLGRRVRVPAHVFE